MQMFAQKFLISVVLLGFCCAVPASATLTHLHDNVLLRDGSTAEDDTFQNIAVTHGPRQPLYGPGHGDGLQRSVGAAAHQRRDRLRDKASAACAGEHTITHYDSRARRMLSNST